MASVTHGGYTVISNAEGGWIYTPGHKGNARQVRVLARSTVARVAKMALQPAPHKLDITWVGAEEDWPDFKARITQLYNNPPGTLSVPDEPSVPNTAFMGQPSFSEKRKVEDGYLYEIGMELLEL